jgi:hypothetical protein
VTRAILPPRPAVSDQTRRFRKRVRALTTKPPPAPWTLHEAIPVGGLTCVGFGEVAGQDFLLVVSHDGRGVFDLAGTRVARDRTPLHDRWHDDQRLTAIGIGPLAGIAVPIAGLWGGGLPLMTGDGWGVERMPVDWPDERIVLRAPHPRWDEMIQIHHETVFSIRAVGFSPSGAALVIASSGEFSLITR